MFECEYVGCGRTFTTAAHLRYHMRTHTGEKPFCCTHEGCGRNFTSSGYLRYHQCTHSGKRTFKCQHPTCERVFAWPAHLKYHMKTHTGDRAYRCTFEGCNKSFYVLQRLNVHMRVHTGERPYTCAVDNCNKSFTTQGNLKNHMRIHTGGCFQKNSTFALFSRSHGPCKVVWIPESRKFSLVESRIPLNNKSRFHSLKSISYMRQNKNKLLIFTTCHHVVIFCYLSHTIVYSTDHFSC